MLATTALATGVALGGGSRVADATPPAPFQLTWAQATKVQLPLSANSQSSPGIGSISCPTAGDCTAVGGYTLGSLLGPALGLAMAAAETSGTWAQATGVAPPPNAVSTYYGSIAALDAISCYSVGNCTAVGSYTDTSGSSQAMAATDSFGVWAQATEVTAPVDAGGDPNAALLGMSCSSVGNCTTVGSYTDSSGSGQAMAATETSGTWAQATEVAAPANAADDPEATLLGMSCSSFGNCTAVGSYTDSSGSGQAMTATETSGTWAQATEVTAPPGARSGEPSSTALDAVSCSSFGNCSAVGSYTDSSGSGQAMAATETSGTWAQASKIASPTSSPRGNPFGPLLDAISCPSMGNCAAVGSFPDALGNYQAMAATETSGSWARATEITPPNDAAGDPRSTLLGISCPSLGTCTAIGSYIGVSGDLRSMAVVPGDRVARPAITSISPAAGPTTGGTAVTIRGTNLLGTSTVRFGLKSATHVTIVSSSRIVATAPAEPAGSVTLTVTTPGGTSSKVRAGLYAYETSGRR